MLKAISYNVNLIKQSSHKKQYPKKPFKPQFKNQSNKFMPHHRGSSSSREVFFSKPQKTKQSSSGERPFYIAQPGEVNDDTCKCCHQKGHHTKDYVQFLKWLNKNSNVKVIFIDESLYLDLSIDTWQIDSSVTLYVTNSLQRFHTKRYVSKGEKISIANGLKGQS